MELISLDPDAARTAIPRSSRAASSSGSGWPGARRRPRRDAHGRAVRRRRSRSIASACRTSSCGSRPRSARRSSSSPTTSTRRSRWATGSRSCAREGVLAQYATPAELLMAPADDFVEDFVGRRPRSEAARVDAGRRHRPLGGATRLRRAGDRRGAGEARGGGGAARPPRRLRAAPAGLAVRRRPPAGAGPGHAPTSSPEPVIDRDDVMRDALSDLSCRHETMYAPVVDAEGRIAGVLSVEIISEFLSSDGGARPRSTRRWSGRSPNDRARRQELAGRRRGEQVRARAARRASATTTRRPGAWAATGSSAPAGRWTTSTATSDPFFRHLEIVAISVVAGFVIALGARVALAPPPRAGPAGPGRDGRALHDPEHRLLLPPPADHRASACGQR